MIIQDSLLTPSKFNRPGRAMDRVLAIVVHYTANPGTSAKANRDFFESLSTSGIEYASAHYVIGLGGEIIRMIPENEIAYHCGGERYTDLARELFLQGAMIYPHNRTIGIEVCIPDETGRFSDASMTSLKGLVSYLMHKYQLTSARVIRHYDVTGKMCPIYYVQHEDEWKKFIESLNIVIPHT